MTLPKSLYVENDSNGDIMVITREALPSKMKLGPYEARRSTQNIDENCGFNLKLFIGSCHEAVTLDTTSEADCNWLCLVPTASSVDEQNCMATQIGPDIFYITSRAIDVGCQLKVWYAPQYARRLGKPSHPDGQTKVLLGRSFNSLLASTATFVLDLKPDKFKLQESIVEDQVEINQQSAENIISIIVNNSSEPSSGTLTPALVNSEAPEFLQSTSCETKTEIATERPDVLTKQVSCSSVERRSSCRLSTKKFSALVLLGKNQKMLKKSRDSRMPVTDRMLFESTTDRCSNLYSKNCKKSNLATSKSGTKLEFHEPSSVSWSGTMHSHHVKTDVSDLRTVIPESYHDNGSVDVAMENNSLPPNSDSKNPNWNDFNMEQDLPMTQLQVLTASQNHTDVNIMKSLEMEKFKDSTVIINQNDKLSSYFSPFVCKEEDQGMESLELQQTYEDVADGEEIDEEDDVAHTKMENEDSFSRHACTFCGKTFEKRSYLARHIKGHLNIYQCNKCAKKFSQAESLTLHNCQEFVREDVTTEYCCERCGLKFNSEKYLLRHMVIHTEGFKCEECRQSFSRKESLLQHLAHCHPNLVDQSITAYPCTQCKKVFAKKISLHNHMKFHSDSFKCHHCAKPFSSAFSLARHNCADDVVALGLACQVESGCFECGKCGKILSQRTALKRHLATHEDSFLCAICGKRHSRKDELAKHVLECSAKAEFKKSGIVKCGVCQQQFLTPREFTQHHKEHTHPYKCDACGLFFLRQTNLVNHCCSASENQLAECQVCRKKFPTAQHLQKHLAVHAERKHICDRCGRCFNRLDYLHDHICLDDDGKRVRVRRTKHSEEVIRGQQAIVCSVCGKSYASISNLNKHVKTHGEKKEVCDICGKQFHLKVLLKEHIKFVHTDEFKIECPHCSKRMKSRNSLYGHIALFHPELSCKKVTDFKCDQCGKVFRQKGNLKKHELTHSDRHNYECKQCAKTFKFPEQMRRHELWHKHGTRHRCRLCDRRFVMKFELRRHVETFHGGAEFVCKYCPVVCHHHQAMKRHLQRSHFGIEEWQVNSVDFIKTMQVFKDSYVNIKQTPASVSETAKPAVADTVITSSDANPALSNTVPRNFSDTNTDLASPLAALVFKNVSQMNHSSVSNGHLPQSTASFFLQTPPKVAQFDDNSAVVTQTDEEALTVSCDSIPVFDQNQQCLVQVAEFPFNNGMIQLPVSTNEGSTVSTGSEYFFLTYNTTVAYHSS